MEERHPRDRVGAVLPGMVGAALDHDLAGPEHDFAVVEHEHDLASDHHCVVERAGAVHHRALAAEFSDELLAKLPQPLELME